MPKPLSIVPTYLRTARDLGMVETALRTLRETAGSDCDLVVVDDCSPADDLMGGLRRHCDTYDAELLARDENGGFARAVNVGLRRAKDEGRDAVLVNADIEFTTPGWLEHMVEQRCLKQEGYASVVGALLLYANGLIQHGGVHFCSPADEPVLTVQDGFVPIAELDPERHGLVGYARKENRIFRCATEAGRRSPGAGRRVGGYAFSRGETHHRGELVVIHAGDRRARVTPNHRLTVHWTEEALASYAVYVMRRGSRWRIGHSKMAHAGVAGERGWALGPRLRLDQQCADALWIVGLHRTRQEALEAENLLAWSYGVPTLQFRTGGEAGLHQDRLDYIWMQLDATEAAHRLLGAHGRDPTLPLLVGRHVDGRRRAPIGPSRRYEIAAANLMSGLMRVPTDPGQGQKPEPRFVFVERERFEGSVYSLDVPPHAHYISGGVVVHNSMLTRDFSHRFQFGPGDLPEAQVPIVCPVTGALQFIRHECLEEVGLYDEAFRLGWEDVDYDVRVWLSGRESVYQPAIQAIHHESAFRGNVTEKIARWTEESWRTFCTKWPDQSFLEFVPSLTLGTGLGVQSIEIARKHA